MICSSRIDVPVGVHPIISHGRRHALLGRTNEGCIKPFVALTTTVTLTEVGGFDYWRWALQLPLIKGHH
jgi:hypothetical protein